MEYIVRFEHGYHVIEFKFDDIVDVDEFVKTVKKHHVDSDDDVLKLTIIPVM